MQTGLKHESLRETGRDTESINSQVRGKLAVHLSLSAYFVEFGHSRNCLTNHLMVGPQSGHFRG